MLYNDAELAALDCGVFRIGIFFRLDTDPVVRLWLGFGDIDVPDSVFDPGGARYTGFGELRAVPVFKQLLNGAAERVEFNLSGVSGAVATIAAGDDAEQIKGKRTSVGFALFAPDWSLLGPVHWRSQYTADFLSVDQQPADAGGTVVRTIALSCGTRFTGRRRPAFSYFSDADQQARFPGDQFCALFGNYAHGFTKEWPVF